MDFVYRKARLSDSGRIAELFEEMLKTIYHTEDVEGYEDGYQCFCDHLSLLMNDAISRLTFSCTLPSRA